jgi:hypothetical protein
LPSNLPATKDEWLQHIRSAKTSLDLAFFYASDCGPDGDIDPETPTALTEVIASLITAAKDRVAIRMIADSGFERTYPALLARLQSTEGVEVRTLNMKALAGGVMHAKYMIADRKSFYAGSANFDWRSLEHIQELGLSVVIESVGIAMTDVFEMDWYLSGGGERGSCPEPKGSWPLVGNTTLYIPAGSTTGETIVVTPVFSPKDLLPHQDSWDLPHILARIDGAQERLWIQVMTFRMNAGMVRSSPLCKLRFLARRSGVWTCESS